MANLTMKTLIEVIRAATIVAPTALVEKRSQNLAEMLILKITNLTIRSRKVR